MTVTFAVREHQDQRVSSESYPLTFEERFSELYTAALRPAIRILHNRDDAEDIAAESLARLFERWDRLSAHPELRAWAARVATNLSLDQLKRRKPASDSFTDRADPSEFVVERMEFAQAIRRLPRRQREVIALRFFADLPDAEVALILRISHATERTHLHRALASLRPNFIYLREQLDELE